MFFDYIFGNMLPADTPDGNAKDRVAPTPGHPGQAADPGAPAGDSPGSASRPRYLRAVLTLTPWPPTPR
jgi:hypothetical protein